MPSPGPGQSFGDGEKSLVDAPVHTFAKSGAFTVKVHLRNLNTNETITQANTEIAIGIEDLPLPPSIEEAPPPSEEKISQEPTTKPFAAFLPLIGTIGGIVFGLAVLGIGIIRILKKIKGGRSTAAVRRRC